MTLNSLFTLAAKALVLAVLLGTAPSADAGAVAPGAGGSASASCGDRTAGMAALPGGEVEAEAEGGGILLAACEFKKPVDGCKKNPCTGKTVCCFGKSNDCYTVN